MERSQESREVGVGRRQAASARRGAGPAKGGAHRAGSANSQKEAAVAKQVGLCREHKGMLMKRMG